MNIYTLPVIDDDGYVTGKPGTVIVASRVLSYVEVETLGALQVGQAGALRLFNTPLKRIRLPDGSEYRKTRITTENGWPSTVWERTN